jgi:hypothetical protein
MTASDASFNDNSPFMFRRKALPPADTSTNEEILRRSMAVTGDIIYHFMTFLEFLELPDMSPEISAYQIKETRLKCAAAMRMLCEVEVKTRPADNYSGQDIAWLKSLFQKPDTRNESVFEQ